MTSDAILVASGVSKTYRDRRSRWLSGASRKQPARRGAVIDVSLALGRGQVLGLVGESGSGKSTLARCLTLLERPDAGTVVLDGVDLVGLHRRKLRHYRRRIQTVFQDPYGSLNPRLSVRSALSEVLRVHGLVKAGDIPARVCDLLELVGLPAAAADRYPSDFSGGQRQRICIARALAAEPDVLIADEAVSSLDVSIQAQILNLLVELQADLGLAMLFISHDLHVVRRIAGEVAVMFGGRVVEVLPAGIPLEAAMHPYTQTLVEALPRLEPRPPARLRADDLASSLPTVGCPFRDRCQHATSICEEEDPPLVGDEREHQVACHNVQRVAV
jgi:oligopeptide transport system ATP-binding protein